MISSTFAMGGLYTPNGYAVAVPAAPAVFVGHVSPIPFGCVPMRVHWWYGIPYLVPVDYPFF